MTSHNKHHGGLVVLGQRNKNAHNFIRKGQTCLGLFSMGARYDIYLPTYAYGYHGFCDPLTGVTLTRKEIGTSWYRTRCRPRGCCLRNGMSLRHDTTGWFVQISYHPENIYVFVCPPVCVSACTSACTSVCFTVCLSVNSRTNYVYMPRYPLNYNVKLKAGLKIYSIQITASQF